MAHQPRPLFVILCKQRSYRNTKRFSDPANSLITVALLIPLKSRQIAYVASNLCRELVESKAAFLP